MLLDRLRNIWDFGMAPNDPSSADNASNLVQLKSRQLHELFVITVFFSGFLFTAQDLLTGNTSEALISFVLIPVSAFNYFLFRKGYILTSKILHNLLIIIIPGLIQLMLAQQAGLIAFYFPIILAAFIVFEERESLYGYVISILSLLIAGFLLLSDFRFGTRTYSEERLFMERVFNISSAGAITVMIFVYLLVLNNRIQSRLLNAQLEVAAKVKELSAVNRELDQRNNQLLTTNSELDNVVYRVSHDLRSPLLSVKGLLNLTNTLPELPDAAHEYLQMASRTLERLEGTIEEILIFTRNSKTDSKPERFNLREMILDIFDDHRFAAGSAHDFQLNYSGSEEILHDRYRLNVILKNLIGNAVKYARNGIPDPYVKVDLWNSKGLGDDDAGLRITVSDNGIGIAEEHQPHVFEMFYRASSGNQKGTGLGLYICSEMVKKLGGIVKLVSEPGKGTSIQIHLPAVEPVL